jgi:hypothetical protein
MKTLKRLKNILSGADNKEEEKTETPQGEKAPETKIETTIDKKEDTQEESSKKTVKSEAKKSAEDVKSKEIGRAHV